MPIYKWSKIASSNATDLYSRVNVGTKVIVLPMAGRRVATQ